MSQKIGNALVIKRLKNRYQLTDLDPEILNLSETVVPTTNADESLRRLKMVPLTQSVTADGTYTILTVPFGKRYYPICMYCKISSGTYLFGSLSVKSLTGYSPVIKSQSAASTLAYQWPFLYYLDYGWQLTVGISSYSVTGDMNSMVMVLEADGENE